MKAAVKIGIVLPCGKVPHECNFYKTKKANKAFFYKLFTMHNDVKIAAYQQTILFNPN